MEHKRYIVFIGLLFLGFLLRNLILLSFPWWWLEKLFQLGHLRVVARRRCTPECTACLHELLQLEGFSSRKVKLVTPLQEFVFQKKVHLHQDVCQEVPWRHLRDTWNNCASHWPKKMKPRHTVRASLQDGLQQVKVQDDIAGARTAQLRVKSGHSAALPCAIVNDLSRWRREVGHHVFSQLGHLRLIPADPARAWDVNMMPSTGRKKILDKSRQERQLEGAWPKRLGLAASEHAMAKLGQSKQLSKENELRAQLAWHAGGLLQNCTCKAEGAPPHPAQPLQAAKKFSQNGWPDHPAPPRALTALQPRSPDWKKFQNTWKTWCVF